MSRFRLRAVATGAVACLAAGGAALSAVASVPAVAATAGVAAVAVGVTPDSAGHILATHLATPPSTAQCLADYGIRCYNPIQYLRAYDTTVAFERHDNGAGQTIAVVDSFGSPTIASDLKHFDTAFGLPAPPSLKTIAPAGPIPEYTNTAQRSGWAFETTLDVEYAHAMAPGASILVVATPVAEVEGITGIPQIVTAENYVIDHKLASVISQSFGTTEANFKSPAQLLGQRSAFVNAAAHGVTVLAAAGDDGAASEQRGGGLFPTPENSWPSSDPLVTSVGGTMLTLNANGQRLAPDVVWNDGYGAGGGGLSGVFARPAFQDSVASVVGDHRGTPDISMSAAVNGAAIVYTTFDPTQPGWGLVGGTSEASPLFAGVVADAASLAGHGLGDINPALYELGSGKGGIVDVTSGNNAFGGVSGYSALPGYDLASGLGTVDVSRFIRALDAQVG